MTGSLQIKKGMYYTAIYLGVNSSKPYDWKSTGLKATAKNKSAADKILHTRIIQLELLDTSSDLDQLFSEYMKEWLSITKLMVKENTYHQYELIVMNQIVPYFESKKIKLLDLNSQHLQRYYATQLDKGKSGSTIRRHHANIKKALDLAVRQDRIVKNPCAAVVLPKENPPKNNFYTSEELRKILQACKGRLIETPVLLAATYGLRRSEVMGLKWDAIDFEAHTITIKHTVTGAGKYQVRSDTTKTRASRRSIFLIPEIEEYLFDLKKRQQKKRRIFKNKETDADLGYICVWDDGHLLSPEYLSRHFKNMCIENEIPIYRFHDLRHSSASLLVKYGYSLKEVGEWLGHASIVSTNRYAHVQHQATIQMAQTVSKDVFQSGEKVS